MAANRAKSWFIAGLESLESPNKKGLNCPIMRGLCVVFSFCVFSFAFGAEKSPSVRETYKDLISKAQNLSLQKDRLQATKILVRASFKEKGAGRKEIIQTLKELSEIFYSDKGQQTFELGRSLQETSPLSAVDRYSVALSLEPNNTGVLKALAHVLLSSSQCERALDYATQGLSTNPFDEGLILLKAQASVCLNHAEYPKLVQDLAELKNSPLKLHAEFLKARTLLTEEKYPAAEAQLDKVLSQDSRFPEIYFYLAVLKQKIGKDPIEHYQKYVNLCTEMNVERKRKYYAEPRLCFEKSKAEAEIEKLRALQAKENI